MILVLAPKLRIRGGLLAGVLTDEVEQALGSLGLQAAIAYEAFVNKASPGDRALYDAVAMIMRRLDIQGWIDAALLPVLRAQGERVALEVQRVLSEATGTDVQLSERLLLELDALAGQHLSLANLEPPIRQALTELLHQAVRSGENPRVTANRIRSFLPAGRFVHAGTRYRAQMISRDTTANFMRESQLSMLEAMPHVIAVICRDGIFGPPRSDGACIDRDGMEVSITQARAVAPYHPMCTLGFDAVIR